MFNNSVVRLCRPLLPLCLAGAALAGAARAAEAPKEATKAPEAPQAQALDPSACRTKALDAEKAQDWAPALEAWERVVDRCVSTEEQRVEARAHIKDLRPRVPRNTDPQKARPWKTLVVVFRHLKFSWKDGDKTIEVHKTVSPADEKKIRTSLDCFARHVFQFSCGMLRIDPDIVVIEEPLTKLHGSGKGPFSPAPHLLRPFTDPLIKGKHYDTVFAYVKFDKDQGPNVPAPFVAATFASIADVGGAGFVMVPWHTNYPFPGETDGEMELHEWLHQIDWMFRHVLHYPDELVPTSDGGRFEGENRPGGDTEYGRKRTETTWIRFYQHIMEDHITRQMWSEATMRLAPGQTPPGNVVGKPK